MTQVHSTRTAVKLKRKKKASAASLRDPVKKSSLSQAALKLLVERSKTPAIFNETSGTPPFDLQDK